MFKLSPLGNRLEVDGKEIPLTHTESGIISALLKAKGSVVQTSDLMLAGDVTSEGSVSTHIWRLRRKGIPIVTSPTWGYKLQNGHKAEIGSYEG